MKHFNLSHYVDNAHAIGSISVHNASVSIRERALNRPRIVDSLSRIAILGLREVKETTAKPKCHYVIAPFERIS